MEVFGLDLMIRFRSNHRSFGGLGEGGFGCTSA
jgi:hypothetical protein